MDAIDSLSSVSRPSPLQLYQQLLQPSSPLMNPQMLAPMMFMAMLGQYLQSLMPMFPQAPKMPQDGPWPRDPQDETPKTQHKPNTQPRHTEHKDPTEQTERTEHKEPKKGGEHRETPETKGTERTEHTAPPPAPTSSKPSGKTEATGRPDGVVPPNQGVVEVNKPIYVSADKPFDGGGKLYRAGSGLNGGGTAETQLPIFILGPGAKLENVQFEGGDGIHLLGDATLNKVHGVHGGPDDMITVDGPGNKAHDAKLAGIPLDSIPSKGPANVTITNSSFHHSHDKVVQVNGDANVTLDRVHAEDVGQLLVTLGGQDIKANVTVKNSSFEKVRSHLVRLDSRDSTLDISGVDTDNGRIQVMMGTPSNARGATVVMPSTSAA